MGTLIPLRRPAPSARPLTALECERRLDDGHPALCQILYRGTVIVATDPAFIVAVMDVIDAERVAGERRRSFHVVGAS